MVLVGPISLCHTNSGSITLGDIALGGQGRVVVKVSAS